MAFRSDSIHYSNAEESCQALPIRGSNVYDQLEAVETEDGADKGARDYRCLETPSSRQATPQAATPPGTTAYARLLSLPLPPHNKKAKLWRRHVIKAWQTVLTLLVLSSLAISLFVLNHTLALQQDVHNDLERFSYDAAGKINIALGKPAYQSSTYRGDNANGASNVVDGSFRADMSGHCMHTELESAPWWKVDFGKIYEIASLTVTGRGNGALDCRNNNLEIRVGNNENHTENSLCFYFHGNLGRGITRIFRCNTILKGRWLSVQRTVAIPGGYLGIPHHVYNRTSGCRENEPLELCEVQVYAAGKGTKPDF